MNDHAMRAPAPHYDTTLDRAGFALALGGALGGLVVLLLVFAAGQRDVTSLAAAWMLGTIFSALGIAGAGGPLWLVLHLAGYRRAWHAATLGALISLVLFVGAQTYGFGFLAAPASDLRTALFRWISALGTSALLAMVAAAIALAMWRVAYRRVM
ncbi:hypothetical protein K9B35_03645 [Sphingomonas sp. R647]|uniref:hypothetical protein n=1 Tax=Sphingomonas sp. R647 TaxID=2875233 RepID=UPI001CD202F9|nr:hypothetical protein [Sphingomonas sp. R647]MCA1197050.1 hypothetical protein [Sphingomonas sp. R647]